MEQRTTINVGGRLLDVSGAAVMAIINVTPDSFFAGSRALEEKAFLVKAEKALAAGVTFLDLGGYSSRPGCEDVPVDEEIRRLSWAMELLYRHFPQAVVSIDTFRSQVVRELADRYGSFMVNDISAGELDEKMFETVARYQLPYVAMHMRGTPQTMTAHTDYDDLLREVLAYFVARLEQLAARGVKDVIIDPGFGFAKTTEQNFELLARMNELQVLGRPVLAGLSRKGMIWKTLDIEPSQALTGTTALHWEALRQGALILRAHDAEEAMQTIRLFRAYKNASTHR